jgi:Response regulators consisting of a CheY-like receiver domain and a winged-helix DNA-binding domain
LQTKILVVEDDEDINRILRRYLEREKYEVISAFSGTEAKLQLQLKTFDMIILDLMIPGIPGEELIKEIRKNAQIPILVISAKSAVEDKVNVLKSGADDYMTKPFEREEVLARVEAILRRSKQATSATNTDNDLILKNLILRAASREVFVKGSLILLTQYEFDILHLMLQNPDRVFTKEHLYQDIWKTGYYGEDNTINVHISNIRKKIKEFDEEAYIKTVWGIGFKIDNS